MKALGSYADLRIGPMALESSGNFATITHQTIFQEKHRTIVERNFDGEVTTAEVYQARLGDLVTRLELSGSTLQAIEQRYSNPYVSYDPHHDISFPDAVMLVKQTDLSTDQGDRVDPAAAGLLPYEFQARLSKPDHFDLFPYHGWDLSALLERLSAYDTLRVLAERHENLDLMVVWDFMDVVHGGYFSREEFTVGSIGGHRHLLVTEGTSDTDIIRHAFNILRPDVADFFRYVDMEKNYPFGGHGNLLNFMKGLNSIGVAGGILAIFDNDTAGVGSLRELSKIPGIKAVKLPDLAEFRAFPTVGPGGEQCADINGRAAAIECYLKLPDDSRVRWSSFDARAGEYQGAIDQTSAEKSAQRDAFLKTTASDAYPFEKIKKVLDVIVEACVAG
ncbi:HEPN/Toprim-associated domain-containing protein [Agrobacterium fabrum]|nr:HEPN/Toprim-associated domain-containing protein [Agrobacterium fabrum]